MHYGCGSQAFSTGSYPEWEGTKALAVVEGRMLQLLQNDLKEKLTVMLARKYEVRGGGPRGELRCTRAGQIE